MMARVISMMVDGSGDDNDSNSTVNAEENNESWESKIFQQKEVF